MNEVAELDLSRITPDEERQILGRLLRDDFELGPIRLHGLATALIRFA